MIARDLKTYLIQTHNDKGKVKVINKIDINHTSPPKQEPANDVSSSLLISFYRIVEFTPIYFSNYYPIFIRPSFKYFKWDLKRPGSNL